MRLRNLHLNDATYTAVKSDQCANFNRRYIATDLVAPDYVALARAFGINSTSATTPNELRSALTEAINRPGSTLIEVSLTTGQW